MKERRDIIIMDRAGYGEREEDSRKTEKRRDSKTNDAQPGELHHNS